MTKKETAEMNSSEEKRYLLEQETNKVNAKLLQRRLWINALVLDGCNLLTYSGVSGLNAIESSLNSKQGLGVTSQAVNSAFKLVGALLAGVFINILGCKRTIVWAVFLLAAVPLSNFYPSWATLVSGAIVGGTASGISIVARKVYTSTLAHQHSDLTELRNETETKIRKCGNYGATKNDAGNNNVESNDVTKADTARDSSNRARTQGLFFILQSSSYKLSSLTGNLVSSLILNSGDDQPVESTKNAAAILWSNGSVEVEPQCGATYCNEDIGSDFTDAPGSALTRIYVYLGFCASVIVISAILMYFFLDDLNKPNLVVPSDESSRPKKPSTLVLVWRNFCSTIALHRNIRLLLILPTSVAIIACTSFWSADFSKAYITCPLGMEFIGYVMMWMGAVETLATFTSGLMSSQRLRVGPLVVAPLLQLGLAAGLLYWIPDENSLVPLILYSAAWAFVEGVRHVLIPALMGVVFRNHLEYAFSNFQVWTSIGSVLMHSWSNWLCTDVKIYITISILGFSIIFYVLLEVVLEFDRKRDCLGIKNNSSS